MSMIPISVVVLTKRGDRVRIIREQSHINIIYIVHGYELMEYTDIHACMNYLMAN